MGHTAHLKDYIRVLIARRWIVISAVTLAVLGMATYVLTATPEYRAKATLLIEPSAIKLMEFSDVYDPTLSGMTGEIARREFYATQHTLILSRQLLEKTFEKFNFSRFEEFSDATDPIDKFGEYFHVAPVRGTRLVDVTFDWKDPKLASKVLAYHVDSYILSYRQRSLGVSLGGIDTLKRKSVELKPRVEEASDKLQKFMVENNMVSLEESQNIVVERLKEISKNLTITENDRIKYKSVIDNISNALKVRGTLKDIPEVADSKIIQHLKVEYIQAKKELEDLSERFGVNHSEVKAVSARLGAISRKMTSEMRSIMVSAQAQLERAEKQTTDLKEELAKQEKNVLELNSIAGKYNLLKEAHETLRATYQTIDKRVKEIEISLAAGSQHDNIFIIQSPEVPLEHENPKRLQLMFTAIVTGALAGILLAFFIDYLDTSLKTKEETEKLLDSPVIGFVPGIDKSAEQNGSVSSTTTGYLHALNNPRSATTESFRSIRTALEFTHINSELKTFLVTSASPSEGKTFISLNIAIAMVKAGKKVLLVDADLRRPRLHKVCGTALVPGLSNLLAKGETAGVLRERALDLSNLTLIPAGDVPPNPAELLGSLRMKEFIETMNRKFDIVIVDTPPTVMFTDASILCKYISSAILVVRSFSTQRDYAKAAKESITQSRETKLGVVLNNADAPYDGYYSYTSDYHKYYYDNDDQTSSAKSSSRSRKIKKKA